MPRLPHNFPTLRRNSTSNHRASILLLGAGVSHGLVRLTETLLKEKRAGAELRLGCSSVSTDLYKWADDIVTQLMSRNDPNPKLTLAQSLDILSDSAWLGCISAERSSPRHRVIARFAREKLWHQIWSLNWDCVQENAFESVGIKRDGTDANMPWPTVFRVFITGADCAHIAESYSVKVFKPHGCAMALIKAKEAEDRGDDRLAIQLAARFLITNAELERLAPNSADATQSFIFAALCTELCSRPFAVAGWKASEQYLLNYMQTNVCPTLEQRSLANDELSIIVPTYRPTHERLTSFYRKTEDATHIHVERDNGFTMNRFFLWLQALYAAGCLKQWALDSDKIIIAEIAAAIDQPPDTPLFVDSWADSFLPVWVRLCWRCELIECRDQKGQPVKAHHIPLESRDEHIPWTLPAINRPELTVASQILATLYHSANRDKWDYDRFPGAFYRDNHLVIPLPAWGTMPPNDLRGLKPLIEAIIRNIGYIDRVSVLLLCPGPTDVIPDHVRKEIKEVLARELALARFANGNSIEEMRLEDL